MAIADRCEGCREIGEGFDAVDLAGLDQWGNAIPSDAAFVVTCEEGVLSVQSDRSDQVFDTVVVDLDAPVGQEGLQTVPVIVDVGQLFAQPGFGGDLTALRLQPFAEGCDQRGTASLTGGQALAVRDTTDISFNGINLGDAAQAFGGDF